MYLEPQKTTRNLYYSTRLTLKGLTHNAASCCSTTVHENEVLKYFLILGGVSSIEAAAQPQFEKSSNICNTINSIAQQAAAQPLFVKSSNICNTKTVVGKSMQNYCSMWVRGERILQPKILNFANC